MIHCHRQRRHISLLTSFKGKEHNYTLFLQRTLAEHAQKRIRSQIFKTNVWKLQNIKAGVCVCTCIGFHRWRCINSILYKRKWKKITLFILIEQNSFLPSINIPDRTSGWGRRISQTMRSMNAWGQREAEGCVYFCLSAEHTIQGSGKHVNTQNVLSHGSESHRFNHSLVTNVSRPLKDHRFLDKLWQWYCHTMT